MSGPILIAVYGPPHVDSVTRLGFLTLSVNSPHRDPPRRSGDGGGADAIGVEPATVALFPDRLAHYRLHAFRAIASELAVTGWRLHVFAAERPSVSTIPLASADVLTEAGGTRLTRLRELAIRGVVLWQTRIISTAWSRQYPVVVLWGEAHRMSSWLALIVARLRGKTTLVWTHGLYGREGMVKRALRVRFYALADHILLYGTHARGLLIERGFEPARMTVVHNALDHETHVGLRGDLWKLPTAMLRRRLTDSALDDGERLLVFVGRLTRVKRVDLLIRALAHLTSTGAGSYRVIIVGDGSERETLLALTADLGVRDRVVFRAAEYDERELATIFCAADLCVSPGDVGLLAVHALTYGTPVVTHDDARYQGPESETVQPGVTGELFRRGDAADLGRAIDRWFGRRPDAGDVRRRCAATVDVAYTPRQVARRFTRAALEEHARTARGAIADPQDG